MFFKVLDKSCFEFDLDTVFVLDIVIELSYVSF